MFASSKASSLMTVAFGSSAVSSPPLQLPGGGTILADIASLTLLMSQRQVPWPSRRQGARQNGAAITYATICVHACMRLVFCASEHRPPASNYSHCPRWHHGVLSHPHKPSHPALPACAGVVLSLPAYSDMSCYCCDSR